MINELLVGLDGSALAELVLPYVEAFALVAKAPVRLIRVIRPEQAAAPLPDENPELLPVMVVMPTERAGAESEEMRNARHEAEHYLDRIVQRLGEKGIVANGTVIPGDPSRVLVEEAVAQKASLILLCTHGRSGLGKLIHGSVAEAVVAHSSVPVLLVRAWKPSTGSATSHAPAPILVPLDGTTNAERALPIAGELAKALSTELKLVEVMPPMDVASLTENGWRSGEPQEIQKEEQDEARKYLTSVANRLRVSGIVTTISVRSASIGSAIADEAAAGGASLVVMAPHAEPPVAQVLVRSVSLDVLHHVSVPVLLVGPRVTAD